MSTLKSKPTLSSTSPKRKTKKPAVLKSVTKKLEGKELKRALTRRQRQGAMQGVFDEAVPENLRMHLLLKTASTQLAIRQNNHLLSPFVINLKHEPPTPEVILENSPLIRLNFLHPSLERVFLKPTELEPTLTLNSQNLHFQIQEDALPTSSKPVSYSYKRKEETSVTTPAANSFAHVCLPNQQPISLETFVPKPVPENIFAYFDLPENEPDESDESELVELDQEISFKPAVQPAQISPKWKPTFSFPPLLRPVGAFILISFIFVLPLHAMNLVSGLKQTKIQVETESQEAFNYLKTGTDAAIAQETQGAANAFSQANARFSRAQSSIQEIGLGTSLLLSTIPQTGSRLTTGKTLVTAGEQLTIAGSYMTAAMDAIARETNPTPVSRIRLLQSYLQTALPHLSQANKLLQAIDLQQIPEEHQSAFLEIQGRLPPIVQTLSEFSDLSDLAIQILGGESTKRYLLIFQNNTEIRPTGGFMGSFAELKVRNGVMENLTVPSGGTYDLQGYLQRSRIAPKPIQLINARWEFQDANWFPDFPTSARQIIELYQDAGGPSVDGVIAINATYVADLIGLLGPIDMPDYQRTIDQENFLFEAQKIVELEYDRAENKPKQFIGDLAPKLVERVLEGEPEQFLTLIDHLSTGLTQKDIQLYFSDEQMQRKILQHRWGGAIEETSLDYLMVVNTNLGGGKTDGVIEEQVNLAVDVDTNGSIINTVTIKRTHHGMNGTIFTGVNNVNYLRIYVPKGSELLESDGFRIPDISLFEQPQEDWIFDDDLQYAATTSFIDQTSGTEIYEEQGKTVFGNWVQTSPGETTTIRFRYQLPFSLLKEKTSLQDRIKTAAGIESTSPYSLMIQKQAGTINRTTSVSVSLPKTMEVLWKSHDLSKTLFNNSLDTFFAFLLK